MRHSLFLFNTIFAQVVIDIKPPPFAVDPDTPLGFIISNLLTIAFVIAIILALFFIIYGAIRWIISGGDQQSLTTARSIIVNAIIGLVILIFAFVILNFATNLLGAGDVTRLVLPSLEQPPIS